MLNLERSAQRAGAVRAPCCAEEWVALMTALAHVSNPLGPIRFSKAALGTCGHPSALAPPSWVPASPGPCLPTSRCLCPGLPSLKAAWG